MNGRYGSTFDGLVPHFGDKPFLSKTRLTVEWCNPNWLAMVPRGQCSAWNKRMISASISGVTVIGSPELRELPSTTPEAEARERTAQSSTVITPDLRG